MDLHSEVLQIVPKSVSLLTGPRGPSKLKLPTPRILISIPHQGPSKTRPSVLIMSGLDGSSSRTFKAVIKSYSPTVRPPES